MTQPRAHRWIPTEDGSLTLYSEHFQEACHSTSGAREETLLHYLRGCQIVEKLRTKDALTILEVGFGTGLGLELTYEETVDLNKPLHFVSLEIDRELVEWFFARPENSAYKVERKSHMGLEYIEGQRGHMSFVILIGNARQGLPLYLKHHPLKWHAIYQDAFSPKRNPVLWTTEWFELLKNFSAEDVILSTYSASSSIRKSLREAGWQLSKGDKFGPKRSSTRARLTGETDPDIAETLERSPVSAIRDQDLSKDLFA